MVSEDITNTIRNELLAIANKPKTPKQIRTDYRKKKREYLRNPQYRDEGVDDDFVSDIWNKIESEVGESEELGNRRELERQFNSKFKPLFLKEGSSNWSFSELSQEDFDAGEFTLNTEKVKNWEETQGQLKVFLARFIATLSELEYDNAEEILAAVDMQVEDEVDSEELGMITKIPRDIVAGITNIRITKQRDATYVYWKKVSREHKKLLKVIKQLQKLVEDGNSVDDEIKDKILLLPNTEQDLPNYIQEIPAKEVDFRILGERIRQWMGAMIEAFKAEKDVTGPSLPKRGTKELTREAKRRLKIKTLRLRGTPIVQERRSELDTLDENDLNEALSDWEFVDPIYYNLMVRSLPVRAGKETEKVTEWLNNAISRARRRNLTNQEESLKKKLELLEEEAFETKSPNDKFHLPLTSWVANNYKELADEVANVEKKTSQFFELLSDILIEAKGQERLQMEPNYPKSKPEMFAPPASPYDYQRKPSKRGLRRQRAQAGKEAEARKFDRDTSANVVQKITQLTEVLDDYYFTPIIGKERVFVDEILPDFSSDISGNYDFYTLSYLFSYQPTSEKALEMGAQLEKNFNYDNLLKISIALKNEISSEVKDAEVYEKSLNQLAKALSDWSDNPDKALSYVANQCYQYLISRGEEDTIGEWRILGKSAKTLNEKFDPQTSIILDIRGFLTSKRFESFIQAREQMGVNVDKINKVKESILDSTSEDKVNSVSDIGKSLLLAHDVIRKMQGRETYHAKLSLLDVDAMGYLITKMENKYKIDLTANDIRNIVYSNNSINALSKNYGLSENVIYEIKGLCR